MTETMNRSIDDIAAWSDDELLARARAGDANGEAMGELYRRFAPMARRVAARLLRTRDDAEDVVNDAFAGVIAAIGSGNGPTSNFRHYLMASVRNGCMTPRRSTVSADEHLVERHGPVVDESERLSEAGVVATAFRSLSPLWQRTLWLTAVEGRTVGEAGRQLGKRPGATAALAKRARDGFAEEYLRQHQALGLSADCARVSGALARYVRRRAGAHDRARVEAHLEHCCHCRRAVEELRDLNGSLRSLSGPGPWIAEAAVLTTGATAIGLGTGSGWFAGVTAGALAKVALAVAVVVPGLYIAAEARRPASSVPSVVMQSPAAEDAAPSRAATIHIDDRGLDPARSPEALSGPTVATVGTPAASGPGEASTVAPSPTGPGTSAPATGSPGIAVPAGSPVSSGQPATLIPSAMTPSITTPVITTPALATPTITTPSITTPAVTVSIPPITVPVTLPVTLPPITVPAVTVPSVTVPSVTVPAVTVPSVTVPAVTLPPVTLPPVTVPPVTLPPLPGLGLL